MKNTSLLKYSIASAGDSAMYSYVNTFWLFYLTTVAGVPPAAAGAVTAVGAVFQAVASPFFAACSDRLVHRLGRRRPFILFSALPLGFFACLMFTKLPLGGSPRVALLFLLGAGFWVLFAAFFIPHLAWGAEIATDYNERTAIRTYAYVMYTVGFLLGNVVPTIAVDGFGGAGLSEPTAWLCVTVIVAAPACGCILYTGLAAPEQPSLGPGPNAPAFSLRALLRDYRQVLKLRPLRLLIFAVMAYLIGNSMVVADRMYAFTFQMGFSGPFISALMLVFGLLGIFLAVPMMRLAKRFDKRTMLIACLGVGGCLMASARLVEITRFSLPLLLALLLVYAAVSTAYWQLMPAAFYDICEVDEYENNVRRAGTITSTLPMAQALASAVGMQTLGIWLELKGFAAGSASQSAEALAAVFDCFTLVPGLLFAAAALFMFRFPITKQRFEAIKRELAARRREAGETDEADEAEV
ncbi:MAG: MFS transporter [Clostridiales Family XIII bacterium]|jgi:GPH family glycoside/pentoside/hexuronide:cation symporter|nr:MFS transporter [Clostridiales Family XIII bacterium]